MRQQPLHKADFLILALLLSLGVLFGGNVLADEQPRQQPEAAQRSAPEGTVRVQQPDFDRSLRDPELIEQLNLARRLMRAQNYMGASAVLEVLYEKYPKDVRVYSQLHTCYLVLQYYDKAVDLNRRMAETHPNTTRYLLNLAQVYTRKGARDSAVTTYDKTVAQLEGRPPHSYNAVIKSMLDYGFAERALEVIDRVRLESEQPDALTLERAEALQILKRYREATAEYFTVVDDTTRLGSDARKKLDELLDFPDSAPATEEVLLEYASGDSARLEAVELLSSYYLKDDRFDKAFQFAQVHDSLSGRNGRSLVTFMRRCQDRSMYAETAELGRYVLGRYDTLRHAQQSRFILAEAYASLGKYDTAMAHYDTIATSYPRLVDKAMALYQKGRILLDHLNRPDKALALFDSVVTHYHGGEGYIRSQLAIPYCHLRQGRLLQASDAFQGLLKRRLTPDMTEEVMYHIALIRFFGKNPDSARADLNRLLVEHPDGYFINDAIGLLMVMDEAEEDDTLLYDYSNALLFEQMRQYDSMVAKLESVVEAENQALADVALYRLSRVSFDHFDTTAAMGYIDRLTEGFPESYYTPFGQKTRADVLMADPDTREKAVEIYRELLKQHPNYPFTSAVREILRQVEVDQNIG